MYKKKHISNRVLFKKIYSLFVFQKSIDMKKIYAGLPTKDENLKTNVENNLLIIHSLHLTHIQTEGGDPPPHVYCDI